MPKKAKSIREKAYHARLENLPCVLCETLGQHQTGPTKVHHIREGQGASQRASHWLCIPLCYECHQGDSGVHGSQSLLRIAKVSELDLLALTIERIAT